MMRKVFGLAATAALIAVSAQSAAAQKTGASGFTTGYTDIGPTLGIGNVGNAGASIGGRFEHAIMPLPNMGNGTLAIQATFDYYSWSNSVFSYKYVPVGVLANYHFHLDDPKIDPFLGLGLGYQIISCSYSGVGADLCNNSAIYFIGRAGARYFFSPKMAVYGDVGAGAATLNLGVMFRLQ